MKELTFRESTTLVKEAQINGLSRDNCKKLRNSFLKLCHIGKSYFPGDATLYYSPKTKSIFLTVNSFEEIVHFTSVKTNYIKGNNENNIDIHTFDYEVDFGLTTPKDEELHLYEEPYKFFFEIKIKTDEYINSFVDDDFFEPFMVDFKKISDEFERLITNLLGKEIFEHAGFNLVIEVDLVNCIKKYFGERLTKSLYPKYVPTRKAKNLCLEISKFFYNLSMMDEWCKETNLIHLAKHMVVKVDKWKLKLFEQFFDKNSDLYYGKLAQKELSKVNRNIEPYENYGEVD